MLESVIIKDFALIEAISLEFERGFTVLSGETGAGKSILIGALSFLLGGKGGAENIRAGIMAVDNGQMEGGRSLGFTYSQTMRYIILPQAIKNAFPALGNEFITLLKETSIVGYVAIQDLTKAADFIISRTYEAFYPLIAIAIIYFVLVWGLTQLLATVERRMRQSDLR